jgi:hypothetical protein
MLEKRGLFDIYTCLKYLLHNVTALDTMVSFVNIVASTEVRGEITLSRALCDHNTAE